MLIWNPTTSSGHFHVDGTEIYATPDVIESEHRPRIIRMNVSAYTKDSDECGKNDNVTASGRYGIPFYTAASDDLPFGTLLRVNGRIYEVMDRFGGGYSNRLDLMMETKEQCFAFGRQYIDVEILE